MLSLPGYLVGMCLTAIPVSYLITRIYGTGVPEFYIQLLCLSKRLPRLNSCSANDELFSKKYINDSYSQNHVSMFLSIIDTK